MPNYKVGDKFKVIDDYDGRYSSQAVVGDTFSWGWNRLEHLKQPTNLNFYSSNSIGFNVTKPPAYILCKTPELAKAVLEKLERDYPDLRWRSGNKPTQHIPDSYYPELVIDVSKTDNMNCSPPSYYQKNRKDYSPTLAEDYLGIAPPSPYASWTEHDYLVGFEKSLQKQVKETQEKRISQALMGAASLPSVAYTASPTIDFSRMTYAAVNPDEVIAKYIAKCNKTNKPKNKFMSKIVEFAKNLNLSKEDKIYRDAGLKDEQGRWTKDAHNIVGDLEAVELGYADYADMGQKINFDTVGTTLEVAKLIKKHEAKLLEIATKMLAEESKKCK